MQDGRALQAGTSHDLGQNFGKAFNVQYQTESGDLDYVWQSSWGVSTRLIGGVIMAHSDDDGLVLPPKLAPIEVALVPIFRKAHEKQTVFEVGEKLAQDLKSKGISVVFDKREHLRPGAKFYSWERKGVPLRLELGPRDVKAGHVLARRRTGGERETIPFDSLTDRVALILEEMQREIHDRALKFRGDHTVDLPKDGDFLGALEPGDGTLRFVRAHWCGDAACELKIKEDTKATIRCIEFDAPNGGGGACLVCGKETDQQVLFARAY